MGWVNPIMHMEKRKNDGANISQSGEQHSLRERDVFPKGIDEELMYKVSEKWIFTQGMDEELDLTWMIECNSIVDVEACARVPGRACPGACQKIGERVLIMPVG